MGLGSINFVDMDYILALDQGTTSSRALVFDRNGHCVASAQKQLRQIYPRAGWVEHDAREIWASQHAVACEALQRLKDSSSAGVTSVCAIAVTNQRETIVVWDRATGQPISNAIVWQDRRTAAQCEVLRGSAQAERLRHKTGLVIDAYFSATKLQWLLENIPGARLRADRGELACGTIDSWLIWNLTGGRLHATDPSNAARTMLFNIHTLCWDSELLEIFDIPRVMLPDVHPSSGILGETDASVFGVTLPIAGVAGDQQAAMFGQGCFAPGMAKATYGTGCFLLMNTGATAAHGQGTLLNTIAWQGPGGAGHTAYCLEGSVFMGGATVQWLRDGLGIVKSVQEVEEAACRVDDTDDVYLVPAFAGLGAPYWDGFARGTLIGMTRGTTGAHIARAALEAIALQCVDVFEAMGGASAIAVTHLRVDGGASVNNLLMQLQADYLGVTVERPKLTETTALGAAYLAGLAVGYWSDVDGMSSHWQLDRRFEPRLSPDARQDKLGRWRQAVARSRHWAVC